MTLALKNAAGTTISTDTVDLPLESVVVNGSYDSTNKKIVLTLQSGSTIDIPVGDLVSGLQAEITSSNKLSADLVDDTNTTNKFFSGDYDDLTDKLDIQAFDVLDLPNTVFNFTNAERGIYKLDRVNTFYGKVDGFSAHQLTGMDAFELAIIKKYSDASTNENFARLYGYSTSSSLATLVGAPVVYYVKKESGGDIGFYQSSNGTGSTVTLTDGAQTLRGVKTFNDIPVVSSYTAPTSNTQLSAKKYVDDSVSTKQNTIDSSHKLSADLVDDSTTTNKFVTTSDKTTWSGKQDALVSGTNIKTINNTSLLGSGNIEVSASYDLISEEEIDELFDGPTPPPTPAVTIDLRTFSAHWGTTWSTNDAELATELSGIWIAQQDTPAEIIISNNASVDGTLTGFDGNISNKTMNLLAQPGFSILIAGTEYIQITQAG